MAVLVAISRVLLGLVFVIFGLNYFTGWIPVPPPETATAKAFMGGLAGSKYFFPFLKGTEVVCGLMLLANRFVSLSLLILAPILINIALYHRLAAGGPPMDIVLIVLSLIVAYDRRDTLAPIFRPGN